MSVGVEAARIAVKLIRDDTASTGCMIDQVCTGGMHHQ